MYSVMLIRGNECELLPKYLEASECRCQVAKESKFNVASEGLRDAYLLELDNRGQASFGIHAKLKSWKEAPIDRSGNDKILEGKKVLTEVIRARACIRRVGGFCEQYKHKVSNGYLSHSREYPVEVVEAHRQMEHFRPLVSFKKKNEDSKGTQYLQDRLETLHKCFRCEKTKPTCNKAKNCKFDTKEDGSLINSQDVIAEKFCIMKEEVKKRKAGGTVGGSNHALQGEILPNWDDVLVEEDSHNGNAMFDWAFLQDSQLERDLVVDQDKKEIWCDVSEKKNHSCNQAGSKRRGVIWKMWELLLDNQSTCDVIINPSTLKNIRKCKWTLRL